MKYKTWNNNRGSIMMVAVLFAILIAISVGSFLKLANHESRLSNIAFHSNSSLNLAEAGVEMALYAMNHGDWSGWTVSGTTAEMGAETLDLGENASGIIHARILSLNANPIVQAEGKLELPNRPSVTKQVEVRLSRRSLFANGITTRRGVTFKGGNVEVDSYRSSLGLPSSSNRNDAGSVASVSVEASAIDLSNSKVFGYVATGGSMPKVGPNGRVYGKNTPSGVKIDMSRVALDFASDFPDIDAPATYDIYQAQINGGTIGTQGATKPTVYKVRNISISGNTSFTVNGPVVMHVEQSVDVKGNAYIRITQHGSLTLYVDGDVDIAGNGAVNETHLPANLLIYGTNKIGQTFKVAGNGNLFAAIYAPNADVEIKGNGDIGGAVVADMATLNGNAHFHYDEDLADFGSEGSYRMDKWRELHLAADRVSF